MRILSIDPGPAESAWVIVEGDTIISHGKCPNDTLLMKIRCWEGAFDESAIEMIASYGMAVGKEVFETCVWIGRFFETITRIGREPTFIYRKDVKMYLCNSMKAKDTNIRQALIDIYGPVGTKKNPGKLFGVTGDQLAALGVALTYKAKKYGL